MSTHRTEWHAEDTSIAAYLAGDAPPVLAASLEAHLLACGTCRSRLAELDARDGTAERDRAWALLADHVDRPSRSPWLLRSTVATPALLRAALVAVALVGLVPLLTAATAGERGLVALLVAAPLAPVVAVALAFRAEVDPAGQVSLATPAAGLRLVSARALVVAGAALPAAYLVLAAVDHWWADVPVSLALAWCLPGLALASTVLAAGTTRLDPTYVAVSVGVGWALVVGAGVSARRRVDPEAFADLVAHPTLQLVALLVAVAAVATTVVRRDAVAYRRTA
ncbi:zf-HC2 domain-containing protein [Nocardioides abyssi]|uniref:Zf-HC2 domain-containing protein n=1 Tax=Nocardioides abyssi TaxID=3058370 RepID=A0ABT8EYY6_9ACTN|nr:zf-HC2 domain-containing protein [Nocardioides abyssi]MDN4163408.1 zf-HC2 domain-containing protein [Nocardioides abyssi]